MVQAKDDKIMSHLLSTCYAPGSVLSGPRAQSHVITSNRPRNWHTRTFLVTSTRNPSQTGSRRKRLLRLQSLGELGTARSRSLDNIISLFPSFCSAFFCVDFPLRQLLCSPPFGDGKLAFSS